jgi:hypothetical protein
MKRPWDQIKLRVLFWDSAEKPEAGDELHTAQGRRYLILDFTETQITALVLPKDEPLTTQRVWGWAWGSKRPGHKKD